jgi:hypothetical protein
MEDPILWADEVDIHPDGTQCAFERTNNNQPSTLNVWQGGIYHTNGTRCPLWTFTRPSSRAPSYDIEVGDSLLRDYLNAVLSNPNAKNVTKEWVLNDFIPDLEIMLGKKDIKEKLIKGTLSRWIRYADLLAVTLEQEKGFVKNYVLSVGEDALELKDELSAKLV